MKFAMVCAVAAFVAAALPFPAYGYCRGCVIETPMLAKAALVANADASSLPLIEPRCHIEKTWQWKNGRKTWRRVEICE